MNLSTIIEVASVSTPVNLALKIGKSILIRTMLEENTKLSYHTESIDLYAELRVIDAIVQTLPNDICCNYKPLQIALENLKQSIDRIHCTLEDLNSKIKYHETLYFSSWRTPIFLPLIDNLKNEWKHVLTRKETLLQTTQYIANNVLIKLEPSAQYAV